MPVRLLLNCVLAALCAIAPLGVLADVAPVVDGNCEPSVGTINTSGANYLVVYSLHLETSGSDAVKPTEIEWNSGAQSFTLLEETTDYTGTGDTVHVLAWGLPNPASTTAAVEPTVGGPNDDDTYYCFAYSGVDTADAFADGANVGENTVASDDPIFVDLSEVGGGYLLAAMARQDGGQTGCTWTNASEDVDTEPSGSWRISAAQAATDSLATARVTVVCTGSAVSRDQAMVGIVLNPTTSDHGILFTGHGTADQQSGSNPDTTPAWPVHQSGDVGVLLFNLVDDNDTVATVATPSGWTLAAECHQSSISLYAYTRAATSGSETNPTLDVSSASASDSTYGRLSVFRGATTTLSAAAQTDADSTFDATHDYPSYTPAHDDTVVYLGFGNTTSTITALSTATNFNNTHQYFENNPGGVDAGGGAQFWVQTSATAITGSTVSTTGGNSDSCSVIFALQAAAAGSAIPVKHHHYQGLRQ